MKSASWPGPIRCRWRRSASISFWASSTESRETAEAMNMSIFWVLLSSRMTVVYGAMTTSSWSCPIELPPLVSRTPTTRNGKFLMRTVWPTGSCPSKRAVATVVPSRQTLAAARTSDSPKKPPFSTFHALMNGHSTPTPCTCVPQFRPPATTCAAERETGVT